MKPAFDDVRAVDSPDGSAELRGAPVARVVGLARRGVVGLLVLLIRGYQRLISPLLGPCCRFSPSCSQYAALSLRKHGVVKGLGKTAWRLLRCHPFSRGGHDPP